MIRIVPILKIFVATVAGFYIIGTGAIADDETQVNFYDLVEECSAGLNVLKMQSNDPDHKILLTCRTACARATRRNDDNTVSHCKTSYQKAEPILARLSPITAANKADEIANHPELNNTIEQRLAVVPEKLKFCEQYSGPEAMAKFPRNTPRQELNRPAKCVSSCRAALAPQNRSHRTTERFEVIREAHLKSCEESYRLTKEMVGQ